ncbi:MAG: D-alanyl-D-alanine carboxypeptidase [Clostridia bacterium]|nr:D-alanyl-D-alanine carboxypeptidase [Clostridia bacterium]
MKKLCISIICILCVCVAPIMTGYTQNYVLAETNFEVDAKVGFLMDYNSSEVLYEQNADSELQIASIVKLMTIYLTLEELNDGKISLSDKLTSTTNASGMGGSQVFIDPNVQYTVEEMLKSVIMASANDASVALAEHISGSEGNFVKRMNKRASELGMRNTVYVNCSGLPAPMQHSTARDTAILLANLIPNETYHKYCKIWMDELIHPSGRKTELVNTNKLIRYYPGCDCGKTGSTDEAGYCLSASAIKDNMRLVAVVMGAKTGKERFNQTAKLFNYGFANFTNEKIVSKSEPISTLKVKKSEINQIETYASEDFYGIVKRGEKANWEVSTEQQESITAPLKSGDKVGNLIITRKGVVVKEIAIVINQDIAPITFGQGLKKIINHF